MPDTKNPHDLGGFIDFIKQNIRVCDGPLTGAVAPVPAHIGEQGEVFGRLFEAKKNPLGGMRIARK